MKVLVKLAVLVVTVLLVTNMAFADCEVGPESCYNVTVTGEFGDTHDDIWNVCFYPDGKGTLHSELADATYNLYAFGGSPLWPSFDLTPSPSTWIVDSGAFRAGHIWTTEGGYYIHGEGHGSGIRYITIGTKVPCPI